ncbi:MAG: ABC transporter ATP-binding protein [Candidatus Omnitrophica bacterium]|nr:ABC transporter ATP-binding protein [Candidatus Omnitrophota bacterium]
MAIIARHIGKEIGTPATRVLTDISLEIKDGEFVALTGRSGSGKSTLLYLLSSLDTPSEGKIEISGRDLQGISSEELYLFRNQEMGFVFQFHYLIAELTAVENVLMPTVKQGKKEQRRPAAEALLEQFDLKDKAHRLPRQLSGGEQQRVAIARSLIMEPKYLFADEPTGSLDSVNGDIVMKIFSDVNSQKKTTVILVTHEPDFAQLAQRQIHLKDGRVQPH